MLRASSSIEASRCAIYRRVEQKMPTESDEHPTIAQLKEENAHLRQRVQSVSVFAASQYLTIAILCGLAVHLKIE